MSVSIFEQIASQAKVSTRTVQRILNGELRDKRPTIVARAMRIRALADKLGYRPNAAAKAVTTGRFGTVALLLSMSGYTSSLSTELVQGMVDALAERELHLTIARLPDDKLTNAGFVPRILRHWSADGLIINYTCAIPAGMIELIETYKLPSVWINCKRARDCVHPDDEGAGFLAAKSLLDSGHRRIVYVDFGFTISARVGIQHYSKQDRQAGYLRALKTAHIRPCVIHDADADTDAAFFERMCVLLSDAGRPTAVLTYGLVEARIVERAAWKTGLVLGHDLHIVTFASHLDAMSIAHIRAYVVPEREVAIHAVNMLSRKLSDKNTPQPAIAVPFGHV